MKPSPINSQAAKKCAIAETSVRLALGLVINLVLLLMVPRLGVWSSEEREFRLALFVAGLGVAGIVALVPVARRGKAWQRLVGFFLLVLPCLSFWFPLEFILKNK